MAPLFLEKNLNKEQLEAVEHTDGPLLIIAGAGTGKTTVITERIRWLVSQKLSRPGEILALTFTQKAAREMEERVDILMPYGYTQMWISTFHSFCDRILREEAIHIGLSPSFILLSDTDSTLLIRKNLFKFALNYFRPLGNPSKFITGMISHFYRLRDEDISSGEYLRWATGYAKVSPDRQNKNSNEEKLLEAEKYMELANAYKKYEELKVKEGLMDYADLITNTLILFRKRENILGNYQRQFKYILVDEFQDTNVAQNELILLLSGKRANLTAVADDDQSIYKFRGAAVSNVLSFRKNFPKAKLIVLTRNYRSSQEILDKSYRLIQHNNPDRLEVKEGINKKLLSTQKKAGDPINFLYTDRVENEADEVVKEIKRLVLGEGKPRNGKTYEWRDFAILLRANNYSEPFVRAFLRQSVPFQFLGPGQLFRQPEVKEIIAYLQVLANYEDNVALFLVLSMALFDISPRDLVAVSNFSRRYNFSLFESCEIVLGQRKVENVRMPFIAPDSKEKIDKVIKMIVRHLKLISKETAGQILYYFLEDTGMIKNILNYQFPIDEKKAVNISKFFSKLKTYESEHQDASVTTVLDWIMLSMELGESPLAGDTDWSVNNAVNILTVHSAKGLEFKVIFIVNLVTGRFPSIQRREQIPIPEELIKEELPQGDYHEQEERRLFYVGMTRAKEKLFFTAANYYGEGKREKKVSPFVYEALGDDATAAQILKPERQLSLLAWKKEELPQTTSRKKLNLSYVSYSQIDAFRLCPLHYKLRYILNIPAPVSPALSLGISVHNSLRDFYLLLKAGEKLTRDKLLDLLAKNWLKEGYTDRGYEEIMKKRGEAFLSNYYDKEFDQAVKTLSIEQPFTTPVSFNGRLLKIGGKIDRMDDLGQGKIEIIDYKTGRMPSQRQVDTNLQLSLYAMAACEIAEPPFGRKPEDVILSLYYFDGQEKISSTRSQKQLDEDKIKILEWVNKIETSDFSCSKDPLCTVCEYKMFCNVYNLE